MRGTVFQMFEAYVVERRGHDAYEDVLDAVAGRLVTSDPFIGAPARTEARVARPAVLGHRPRAQHADAVHQRQRAPPEEGLRRRPDVDRPPAGGPRGGDRRRGGQADLEAAGRAVNAGGIFKLLTKPCSHDLLEVAITEAIALHDKQSKAALLATRMAHTEQLATLGTMSAMMGHEMNNSLSLLGCAIESVEEDLRASRAPDAETVQQLVRGRDRLLAQARGTTALARRTEHELEVLELGDALGALVGAIRSAQVSVGVRQRGGNAVITIADTGAGIEQVDLAKVFEPYFTTNPPTIGTGLGLPVARQIITGYGGTIAIASKIGVGTCVTIELPAVNLDPVPTRAPADTLSP